MFTLTDATAHVVAGDSQAVLSEIDDVAARLLRMAADIVDGLQNSGVSVGQSQRVYSAFVDSAGTMLQARARMIDGIGLLETIRRRSNLAEVDLGCPTPWSRAEPSTVAPLAVPTREAVVMAEASVSLA